MMLFINVERNIQSKFFSAYSCTSIDLLTSQNPLHILFNNTIHLIISVELAYKQTSCLNNSLFYENSCLVTNKLSVRRYQSVVNS